MYFIDATDTIEERCDYLTNLLKEKIEEFENEIIPMYSLEFLSQDNNMIHGTINCFGAMNTYPYLAEKRELIPSFPPPKSNADGNSSPRTRINEENFGTIHYSINIE
jgi:hypothetical protein